MITAFIFDFDGLLVNSERIVQRSWHLAGEDLGYDRLGDNIVNTLGMSREGRKEYFINKYGQEFPYEEFCNLYGKHFWNIAKNEGIPLKKGAKRLLKSAKESGLKIALATSSSRQYAASLLKEHGIYEYFDAITSGDMVTKAKPDPEIYLKACELIDVNPAQAIAFEDAPAGVLSATAAGLQCVFIPDIIPLPASLSDKVLAVYDALDYPSVNSLIAP